jgi:hypothetical protein
MAAAATPAFQCGDGTTDGDATIALVGDGEVARIDFRYDIGFSGAGDSSEGSTVVPSPTGFTPTAGNPNPSRTGYGNGIVDFDWIPAGLSGSACITSNAADFNIFGSFTFVPTS